MGLDVVVMLSVLALVIGLLALTRIAPDVVLLGSLTLLMVFPVPGEEGWRLGVLTPAEAISGLSNPGPVTVGVLFIVVVGLRETGGVDWLARRVLGRPRSLHGAQLRIVGPVAGLSAFLNNTPVVAMLIPVVDEWAKKLGLSASKLMIPLSYAAILGGMCTLIGTSTNLVVNGLVIAETDMPGLGMFDITWVGLPCTLVGLAYLMLVGRRLLPDRRSVTSRMEDPREYTMEMLVEAGSPLDGQSIDAAGLRHLPGAYLVEINRHGDVLPAVGPEQRLKAHDRLVFVGIVESIKDLQKIRGLTPATDQVFRLDAPRHRRCLIEAVVSNTCPLVGKTIRDGRFRTLYHAAVIAVARNNERIRAKIGDIVLRPGDTLLLEAHPSFATQQRNSRDFFLVSAVEDSTPRRHHKAWTATLILAAMVAVVTLGWMSMLVASMLAAGLMIITRCCSTDAARRSVDWSVLIVIAAALGIGRAIDQTGTARVIAETVLGVAGQNPWVALAAVYIITMMFTELITNNAAVALVFPIAMATADKLGVNFMPFVIVIMVAGSASFATPLGYQTNLMVYGPGGYRFSDYLKLGIPMNLVMGVTTVTLAPLFWPF
ncbi:MAG: SLC13 family permease [Phycisphaerales bacterium]|nr:MAG: SLC13 family permease [Phycisphaerales bacterium]